MELRVKSGYVLVEKQDGALYDLMGDFICAKIVAGAPEDIGVTIFCDVYKPFNGQYLLVKVEDVAVWSKPEAVVETPVEVVSDEPKND